LDDLARCRAVFSTAGNQLVGEALWFGKPVLVMPEHTVEQRLNAAAVERLRIGRQVSHTEVTSSAIERFLRDEGEFRLAIRQTVRDGRTAAIASIEGFARELVAPGVASTVPAWRLA
jgi:UDP:flavonoid glycosyltransferase YjiC (YdhE family)